MKPILFQASDTTFTTNGLGRLSDAISCTVTEERNGIYELHMVYPQNGIHFTDLANGRIIYATCSLTKIENEDQINLFLQNNPEFMLTDVNQFLPNVPITGKMLRFTPVSHQTDGFFAAVLQRKE